MRVMQAMAGAPFGGAEAFFTRLVLALHRAGLEQRVLIRADAKRRQTLRDGGIAPVELPFGGLADVKTRLAFRREIKTFQPDVVLTWMNRATRFCPASKEYVHVGRLGGYYNLKYYRHCDHLIGNTRDIVRYLRDSGWPPKRVHYLPNFVAQDRADPVPRASLFTPDDAKIVLAMGRLHPNKGFDVLLKAVAEMPDVYVWIAGEGPLRDELEDLAVRLGSKPRVRFLGWREDTAALFAACDVLAFPSRHEPLGNVVLEAWAREVPVVSAASQGPKSLIKNAKNGLLVPVDDAGAMGHAIREVLDYPDLARRIAREGFRTFKEGYTEDKIVFQYLEFFEHISKK